jgi:glycosyltransferase involved in cell wall biosynthesis
MEKVLILSLGRTGSLPTYAENISKNLSVNFDILISKNRNVKKEVKNSIEVTTYHNKFSFLFNTVFVLPFLLLNFLPKIVNHYTVLYLPYKHFWDIPFILLFKLMNKKIIFTVHDGILHSGERNFITQSLSNIRIKKATELIFLTQHVKKKVFNTLKISKEYSIVPHPIIENEYVDLKKRNPKSKNLLFLGRIDKYKGIELLVESAIASEAYFDKLIIAGKTLYPLKIKSHYKIELIDKYLSDEEIGDLLSWANALVLPYTEATQSGVIALGIFAELPMICTKVGGFSEQLNKNEGYWCNPNKEELSASIKEVFSSTEKNLEIAKLLNQKKAVLSWKNAAKIIEAIIKKQ